MKYRIKLKGNDMRPFVVQRKNEKAFFSFWRHVESFARQHEAESLIKRSAERHGQFPIGSIIFEYDEADAVVDKLKGQKNQFHEGVTSADQTMGQNVQSIPRIR